MKSFLTAILLLAVSTTFSQKINFENLKQTTDSLAAGLVKENEPGLSVGIVYEGRPVLNAHYGLMNLDDELKTSGSTAYNLASVSKHITALGILLLEAEGKLNLENKLGTHLPDLPQKYQQVTINELLHHTAGIPSTDNLRLFAGIGLDSPWTLADELELLKSYSQLNFEPGTDYLYSNGGYSLLAAVIEAASGQDFGDFFRKRVFEPLKLGATAYNIPGKTIKDRAEGYTPAGDKYQNALTGADSVPGGSNFYFCMDDMLAWMNLFLQDNSLYHPQISGMIRPSFRLIKGDSIPYSFGLQVKAYRGVPAIYHSGGTPGFASYMMLFPEHQLGISILTNNEKINVVKMTHQLVDQILKEFVIDEIPVQRIATSLPPDKLKKWTGSYRMKDGMILKILHEEEKLILDLSQGQRFELHPEAETNFFIQEFDAQIAFLEKPLKLNLIQGKNIQTGDYVEPRELIKPSPAPHELVGSYHHKALDVTYLLIEKDGELFVQLPGTFKKYLNFDTTGLSPVAGDVFNTDRLGIIEFLRNDRNEISGFRFNDVGRLRNIEFHKI
ncbi:CubicO group peptidase, beta-lactamase class C family [Salinimicrobium sediminis]|uniref:CubicO group peptidase, beta-lactamase class C family n=1 Tax=Salinimicrobium sediminis TaxID=1343891 RepID=A0A285X9W5_9FLAO|nr:serine hydrolase domain-containing protein [Salinimicrobium sediminis]SOC81574.1 CubicO group peptidase, beta-lactamase class C family [Salinimicrobium sediminis]